jgi:hypothetical protein
LAYLSDGEFKRILLNEPLESVVKQHIFQGTPFVFRDQPKLYQDLRDHIGTSLRLPHENIIVVGSAQVGFSLAPDNSFVAFSEESDIDVVVVNERLFDQGWQTLLRWNYPRRHHLPVPELKWTRNRMEELYWGWFSPDRIHFDGLSFPEALKPLRDLSTQWFDAFQSLSQNETFARRTVSGRLYRTWDHALLYHTHGLQRLKTNLQSKGV